MMNRPVWQARLPVVEQMRLILIQSSTAGALNPAACAIAGMCNNRLVEPPNAAWKTIAFSMLAGVRISRTGTFFSAR